MEIAAIVYDDNSEGARARVRAFISLLMRKGLIGSADKGGIFRKASSDHLMLLAEARVRAVISWLKKTGSIERASAQGVIIRKQASPHFMLLTEALRKVRRPKMAERLAALAFDVVESWRGQSEVAKRLAEECYERAQELIEGEEQAKKIILFFPQKLRSYYLMEEAQELLPSMLGAR